MLVWKKLDNNLVFDHNTPIYGVKFNNLGDSSFYDLYCCYNFATTPITEDIYVRSRYEGGDSVAKFYNHVQGKWSGHYSLEGGGCYIAYNVTISDLYQRDGYIHACDGSPFYYDCFGYFSTDPTISHKQDIIDKIEFLVEVPFSPSKTRIGFQSSGGTNTLNVLSDTTWSCEPPTWITVSPSSGGSGMTEVTISVGEYSGDSTRTEDIVFTNNDGASFTVNVRQEKPQSGTVSNLYLGENHIEKMYLGETGIMAAYLGENLVFSTETDPTHYVTSIHTVDGTWNLRHKISTGIYPTTASTIRVLYVPIDSQGSDRICGYAPDDEGCLGDDDDWRWFTIFQGSNHLDINSERSSSWPAYKELGTEYDITMGNNFLIDNKTHQTLISGTTQSYLGSNAPFYVDVSAIAVKEVQIWDGDTLVFNGRAAEENGNIGLWDKISKTLVYNPDLNMTYEP